MKTISTKIKRNKKIMAYSWVVFAILVHPSSLAKGSATPSSQNKDLASMLGWTPSPQDNNLCHGHYEEPYIDFSPDPNLPMAKSPVKINANYSSYALHGRTKLSGHVVATQKHNQVSSDSAYLNRDPTTNKPESLDVYGNVSLRSPGKLVMGQRGHMNLVDHSVTLWDTQYRLVANNTQSFIDHFYKPGQNNIVKIYQQNGWGKAKRIHIPKNDQLELYSASYSTCIPQKTFWKIRASKVKLNKTTGRGQATNARLNIMGVPVLYSPYLSFPIDRRRKTGFLFPTYGNSSSSGVILGLPYYLNLAPNYDATITPTYYSKRGVLLDGRFRYLTKNNIGDLEAQIIPNDRAFRDFQNKAKSLYPNALPLDLNQLQTANDDRRALSWKDNLQLNEHWSGFFDYNYVSDDYYLQDFGTNLDTVTTNQLLRQALLTYSGVNWTLSAQALSYQTLHPLNQAPVLDQYSRLPSLVATANYPEQSLGLDYFFTGKFDYFDHAAPRPGQPQLAVGGRMHLQPSISRPVENISGYITPTLQGVFTWYDLDNQPNNYAENIDRGLPIANIDAGLYFDRNTSLFHHSFRQTLEPRLYYLYVPYTNQNQIPVFDTSTQVFNYEQIFRTNRFSGIDRIGDANQLAYGITTRMVDQRTGQEKIVASVANIFYFQDRRVTLCTTPNCSDESAAGGTSPTATFSPIAGRLTYTLNRKWQMRGDLAWDPYVQNVNNASAILHYQTDKQHIANFGYSFIRNGDIISGASDGNLNQVSTSLVWPVLSENVSMLANWGYTLSHDHTLSYLYGIQYDSCCWALRAIAAKTFTSFDANNNPQFNTAFYLQIALKGLGNLGNSDPSSLLTNNISGYTDTFGETE